MPHEPTLRELYEKAGQFGKLAFVERPLLGSPGAPAQAQTNVSNIWGHINAGFLFGYEYTIPGPAQRGGPARLELAQQDDGPRRGRQPVHELRDRERALALAGRPDHVHADGNEYGKVAIESLLERNHIGVEGAQRLGRDLGRRSICVSSAWKPEYWPPWSIL